MSRAEADFRSEKVFFFAFFKKIFKIMKDLRVKIRYNK